MKRIWIFVVGLYVVWLLLGKIQIGTNPVVYELVVSPPNLNHTEIIDQFFLSDYEETGEFEDTFSYKNNNELLLIREDGHFFYRHDTYCTYEQIRTSKRELRREAEEFLRKLYVFEEAQYQEIHIARNAETIIGMFFPFGPFTTQYSFEFRFGNRIDKVPIYSSEVTFDYREKGLCTISGFWLEVTEKKLLGKASNPPMNANQGEAKLVYIPKSLELLGQVELMDPERGGQVRYDQIKLGEGSQVELYPAWIIDGSLYDAITGEFMWQLPYY